MSFLKFAITRKTTEYTYHFHISHKTVLTIQGMETTGEGKIASSSTVLYVRPGSMMQKYARKNKLPMKPLAEYKTGNGDASPNTADKKDLNEVPTASPDKKAYVLRIVELIKTHRQILDAEKFLDSDAGLIWSCNGNIFINKTSLQYYSQAGREMAESILKRAAQNSHVDALRDIERYSWRDDVEDGLEYGVDPEDYETEDDYMEALNEEKYSWRDTCVDTYAPFVFGFLILCSFDDLIIKNFANQKVAQKATFYIFLLIFSSYCLLLTPLWSSVTLRCSFLCVSFSWFGFTYITNF